jgi:putative ABC transport system permease protein
LYHLAFLGAIFIGLTFAILLWFTNTINRSANRFLAMALATMILWMIRILAIDLGLEVYLSRWDWLPTQALLVLGPFMYFYVLKITCPEYQFRWKDLLHFSPLLLEQAALALEIKESARTGAATYVTHTFQQFNPVLQLLIFISIITYLRLSGKLIQKFYRRLQPVLMDRPLLEFRWLRRLLAATALLWLLWLFCAAVDYFGYRNQISIHVYYPFYIFFVVIIIWTATAAFLKPQAAVMAQTVPAIKRPLPAELRAKGAWLKKTMEANLYYEDPDLSLGSLAEKLNLHPHELSRIINTVFKKGFNDLVNEYRVRDVISKMKNPAYDHMTLLGIAFEAGFNSQSSFSRIFKQLTGKSPAEFKKSPKKEFPSYNLSSPLRLAPVISNQQTTHKWSEMKINRSYMFRNYLKIAWRNFYRDSVHSSINISGLSIGMAVAMLIGLWMWDELTFDRYDPHYDRVAQVMQNQTYNGTIETHPAIPIPLGDELRRVYGSDFKSVVMSSWSEDHVLSVGAKNLFPTGPFVEPDGPELFGLTMIAGSKDALKEPTAIFLSESVAQSLFGDEEAINKTVRMDDTANFIVRGIYKDPPANSKLAENYTDFMGSWAYYVNHMVQQDRRTSWGSNSYQCYVELADHADVRAASVKIRDAKAKHRDPNDPYKPALFLQPMADWHLYSDFENGVSVGGRIQDVRLFGIIGAFVLLLACINFMNLSTARSEKRAKEVGIRKTIGSGRGQLIGQFFCESLLFAFVAFSVSLLLSGLLLPLFNDVAGKSIVFPFGNPMFWGMGLLFAVFTGIIAGSYPAIYLSSFRPAEVLKGVYRAGRFTAVPRKVLVVLQFTVSVTLIIGTVVVFRQIQFAKDRPAGYTSRGLLNVFTPTSDIHDHFNALRDDMIKSGAVTEMAEATGPVTGINDNTGDVTWKGMDPNLAVSFAALGVTADYGKTVGWRFVAGRDFSSKLITDSDAVVLNETAVKFMGLKQPVGQTVRLWDRDRTVIGVIRDVIVTSPYEPVKQAIYYLANANTFLNIRINPTMGIHAAMEKIERICKAYAPKVPFVFNFADERYAQKFGAEERVGKLAGFFAILAIFISCLGLFAMAAYMAEQRNKEIGVRKVLGASVFGLWRLMSKEFVRLVFISVGIAIPLAYYFMHGWLQNYNYRTGLSWWIFALAALGAVLITFLTVSYQSIKAALMNPVKSLRSD